MIPKGVIFLPRLFLLPKTKINTWLENATDRCLHNIMRKGDHASISSDGLARREACLFIDVIGHLQEWMGG